MTTATLAPATDTDIIYTQELDGVMLEYRLPEMNPIPMDYKFVPTLGSCKAWADKVYTGTPFYKVTLIKALREEYALTFMDILKRLP